MASELEVGKVRVSPANITAELQLYRDDSTINAAGTAIGDINFGGGDADNDNAARLRVKSDAAWTASSSPTAFEFQTCPSGSESPQTRLVIDSTGDVTVNESLAIGTSPTSGISLNVRENSTTTAADIRNANASGFGLYVAGGSSSSQYAFRAANKDNTALFTVRGDGLAEFSNGISNERGIYGGTLSVADDAVGEITPPRQATFMTLSYNATSAYPSHWGALLYLDVGLSLVSIVVAGPSSAVVAVQSDVSGTTGTDGKTNVGGTVAADASSIGKIRIENRHGTSVTYNYNFFG
jgi:hypothetical protein